MQTGKLPVIIQGGMGVGVSNWRLARAVSSAGQLGVISGTALDVSMARRLQLGDPEGCVRRALEHFPIPGVAKRILDRYFVRDGKAAEASFVAKPMPSMVPSRAAEELLVASNFVEVFLAREGHSGPVGVNFLEKIQLPTLPSIYGVMLAGVSCVLMGAGIPRAIPGILDRLAEGQPVELAIDVQGAAPGERHTTKFDPAGLWPEGTPAPKALHRPDFYAIVSSATLATMLAKKASGRVDGFIIEGPTAGGHNAPPRGQVRLTAEGEPIYGERDVADLAAIRALGLPFWLAGSYARPERLVEALEAGAAGVQVGTAFAYCEESGLGTELKQQVLELSRAGAVRVFTDPVASPTGFPFKVLRLDGTLSDPKIVAERSRICDLGYLRHAYKKEDGTLGWRCPAEPIEDYVKKHGTETDTQGRLCVCNALMANIGMAQRRGDHDELPLVTSGDDAAEVARFLKPGETTYTAADVIEYLLQGVKNREAAAHA
ncbi:MAG: nitronate monooxygenase [Phycisphaerales bacterium]